MAQVAGVAPVLQIRGIWFPIEDAGGACGEFIDLKSRVMGRRDFRQTIVHACQIPPTQEVQVNPIPAWARPFNFFSLFALALLKREKGNRLFMPAFIERPICHRGSGTGCLTDGHASAYGISGPPDLLQWRARFSSHLNKFSIEVECRIVVRFKINFLLTFWPPIPYLPPVVRPGFSDCRKKVLFARTGRLCEWTLLATERKRLTTAP